MSHSKKTANIRLTATDCFILALEKHIHNKGTSGNTCRYVFELEGKLDVNAFKQTLNNNKETKQLASFAMHKSGLFSVPIWKSYNNIEIDITVHESDLFLPYSILNKIITSNTAPLFCFDVIHRSNGNSTLVFSWNHLIMDGYGAVLYLKLLNNIGNEKSFIGKNYKTKINYHSFKEAVKAKFYLSASSKKSTSGISPTKHYDQVTQKIEVITFTKEETIQIDSIAPKLGSKFGRSPYFLACAARSVKEILKQRNNAVNDFWIPVPQNQRKKGAMGPLLGNHLSFLFYRINSSLLDSIEKSVKDINEQMVTQVRKGIPKAYDVLMNYLKRIPSDWYYNLIKGPQGDSLSGFLFTLAEDHPSELLKFGNQKVLNALSFPPNTYPPGLTFAFMRFEEKLQLMILYYDEVLNENEVKTLKNKIKYELINGLPFINQQK